MFTGVFAVREYKTAQIIFSVIPPGRGNGPGFPPDSRSVAKVINSAKIGAAPVRPLVLIIGALSAFPTQTPTTISLVYPNVRLSRKSFVVPVLAAAGNGKFSTEFGPNAGVRAALSDRMLEIK